MKFLSKHFLIITFFVLLHHQTELTVLWCNGSTTDSGPVCPGSNPGKTTKLPNNQ